MSKTEKVWGVMVALLCIAAIVSSIIIGPLGAAICAIIALPVNLVMMILGSFSYRRSQSLLKYVRTLNSNYLHSLMALGAQSKLFSEVKKKLNLSDTSPSLNIDLHQESDDFIPKYKEKACAAQKIHKHLESDIWDIENPTRALTKLLIRRVKTIPWRNVLKRGKRIKSLPIKESA